MTWFWHQIDAFATTVARLARTPVGTLLHVGVIGVALALPVGLYVAVVNLQGLTRSLASDPQLSMFLALDAGPADGKRIATPLQQHPARGDAR